MTPNLQNIEPRNPISSFGIKVLTSLESGSWGRGSRQTGSSWFILWRSAPAWVIPLQLFGSLKGKGGSPGTDQGKAYESTLLSFFLNFFGLVVFYLHFLVDP